MKYIATMRFYDPILKRTITKGETYPTDEVNEDWLEQISTSNNRIGRPVIELVGDITTDEINASGIDFDELIADLSHDEKCEATERFDELMKMSAPDLRDYAINSVGISLGSGTRRKDNIASLIIKHEFGINRYSR